MRILSALSRTCQLSDDGLSVNGPLTIDHCLLSLVRLLSIMLQFLGRYKRSCAVLLKQVLSLDLLYRLLKAKLLL